jgi:hypothetical protein
VTITTHVFQVYIAAEVERVWEIVSDPDWMADHLHTTGSLDLTAPSTDRPGRIVHSWQVLDSEALAAEPPSEVVWTVERVSDGLTRVRVVHGDLAFSPLTWARARDGWRWTLDALKTVLETGRSLPAAPSSTPVVQAVDADWHRAQGVEANNSIWELLSRSDRDEAGDEELLRRAYAAAYHWQRTSSAGPTNEARASYMITKALLATAQPQRALVSARHCLAVCGEHDLVDFDLAYAHEAHARVLLALGRYAEAKESWRLANAVDIGDPEDRAIVDSDFADLVKEPRLN